MLYTSNTSFAKLSTIDFDDVANKSKPIFQGINFNQTENDNTSIVNDTENYDENHELMIITTEDVTTVTPDSGEVKAKSKAKVVKNIINNVRPDNIKMVNLSTTMKHINQTTSDTVSQPKLMPDSKTSVQTDHTIKSHAGTEEATSKSLAKHQSFKEGINTHTQNKAIDSHTIYVPRFHIKMNNEIDKTDYNMHHNVLKAVRFKRDIKTLSVPHVQYAPVDIAFRAQASNAKIVPPKPKYSRSYSPVATRTTLKHSQVSNIDTKQKNAMEFKWTTFNKKLKMSKKFRKVKKKNIDITTENIRTIGKSQNFFRKLYLEVIDLESPNKVTTTKSHQQEIEKKWLRVKRDLPEDTTKNVVTIEKPKENTNSKVTPSSSIEQIITNTVLDNLNNTLTKNLNEAVHKVLIELNISTLTYPDNKFPDSNLLFKVPSKYF